MGIRKLGIGYRIKGYPKCRNCGADIRKLLRQGKPIYRNKAWRKGARYLCADCKSDLFEGVKIRDG